MSRPASRCRYVVVQIKTVPGAGGVCWHERPRTIAEGFNLLEARIVEELLVRGAQPLIALVDCTEGRVLAANPQPWCSHDQLVRWARHAASSERGPSSAQRAVQTATSRLVVGIESGNRVVCMREDYCEGLATMQAIAQRGGTWGDLRREAPQFYALHIAPRFADCSDDDAEEPDDYVPLHAFDIPGAADGWQRPAAAMLKWMPEPIRKRFGTEITTTNGNELQIDPEYLLPVVAALEAEGFRCRRDDEAVTLASKFSRGC